MELTLSLKSLKQIKESGIEEDFEIELFNEKIHTSLFVALFLSREIMKQYRNDRTIRQFKIEFPQTSLFYSTPDELQHMIERTNFINQFKLFIEGTPIHIPSKSEPEPASESQSTIRKLSVLSDIEKIVIELSKILDNNELIEQMIEQHDLTKIKETTTIKQTLQNLQLLRSLGYSSESPELSKLFDHISFNFYKLFEDEEDEEEIYSMMRKMSQSDIEKIISSDKLQIKSEDCLFENIEQLGSEFFFLFDYIEVKYLSVENIKKLIEYINSNRDDDEHSIHSMLWKSICRRLVIDVTSELNEQGERNPRENSNSKFNTKPKTKGRIIECPEGIIKYLEQTANGNVYISKTIDVETTVHNGEIKNLFDHSKDSLLQARSYDNPPRPSIILDFKDKRVNLSKYFLSVPSSKCGYSGRPKTWIIEGSNDKENWYIIDQRQNDSSFKEHYKSNTFSIQPKTDEFYRFIRIKGFYCHNGSNQYLLLSEIEFNGRICIE